MLKAPNKKIIAMLFLAIITAKEAHAFLSIGSGIISLIILKGIIPQLIVFLVSAFVIIKKKIYTKNKVVFFLVGAIVIGYLAFTAAGKFIAIRQDNPSSEDFLEGELYFRNEFFDKYFVNVNNLTKEDYEDYKKITSLGFSGEPHNDTSLRLKGTITGVGACNYDEGCIREALEKNNITSEDKILLYCLSGISSSLYAKQLEDMGYQNVRITGMVTVDNREYLEGNSLPKRDTKGIMPIIELKEKEIKKHDWVFFHYGLDDGIETREKFAGRITIVFVLTSDQHFSDIDFLLDHAKAYNLSDFRAIGKLPGNTKLLCSNRINCLWTQKYAYDNKLNADAVYRCPADICPP